jgi:hypothetical protein
MIRFLNLTDDIWGADNEDRIFEFAWYDTVSGTIISFNEQTVWSSWEDFEDDFNNSDDIFSLIDINRFKNIFKEGKK